MPAMLLPTMCMPAIATRSSGPTTAMVYEVRVGTSIWPRKERSCQNSTARVAVGAKAAAIRNRLAGMWVNTIVLISPILAATLAASHRETAESIWEKKKTRARAPSSRPNLVLNQ